MTTTINAEQRRILVRYAGGEELPDIAKATGINGDVVNALIAGPLVHFERQRAAALVRRYDQANGTNGAQPTPAPTPPAVVATIRPAVRDLLDEAEATGDRYLVVRVQKVRALLDEIRERVAEARETQEARAEVARLEAELAAAKARLKGGRTPAPAPPEEPDALPAEPFATAAEIRAWAAEHGIPCPARGLIPRAVRETYIQEMAA